MANDLEELEWQALGMSGRFKEVWREQRADIVRLEATCRDLRKVVSDTRAELSRLRGIPDGRPGQLDRPGVSRAVMTAFQESQGEPVRRVPRTVAPAPLPEVAAPPPPEPPVEEAKPSEPVDDARARFSLLELD